MADQGWQVDGEPSAFDDALADQGLDRESFARAVQGAMQEQLGPMQQAVASMSQVAEARDLVAEYPELGEEETARQTVEAAQQMAQQMGVPQLAASPQMWRLAHLARAGVDALAPTGPTDGGGQAQALTKEMIVGQSKGASCLPFSGGNAATGKDGE
jgi:hypothetical protein